MAHLPRIAADVEVDFPAGDQSEEGQHRLGEVTFLEDRDMAIGEHLTSGNPLPTGESLCRSSTAWDKRSERNRLRS